jgi:putative addiction module component (TIGR02574 family)
MRTADIPEIANLSVPEKILLIEDMWDSIVSNESSVPVTKSHTDELDKRFKAYKSNPGNLLSLNEFKSRIEMAPLCPRSPHYQNKPT